MSDVLADEFDVLGRKHVLAYTKAYLLHTNDNVYEPDYSVANRKLPH